MGAASGYIFAAMWLIIAIYLIFQGFKTTKWFFGLSIFFLYLSAWYLINMFVEPNLFSSPYVWIFRGVCFVFLAITVLVIVINRKKIIKKVDDDLEKEEEKTE